MYSNIFDDVFNFDYHNNYVVDDIFINKKKQAFIPEPEIIYKSETIPEPEIMPECDIIYKLIIFLIIVNLIINMLKKKQQDRIIVSENEFWKRYYRLHAI